MSQKFLIGSALLFAMSAHAQYPVASESSTAQYEAPAPDASSTHMSVEIKGGAGLATVSQSSAANGYETETSDGRGSRFGLNLGAFVNVPVNPTFSMYSGLQFIQKGTKATQETDGTKIEQTAKINYLELPVLARLNFGETGVRFHLAAGPYVALKMNAVAVTEITGAGNQPTEESEISNLSSIDFGFRLGTGLAFPISPALSFLVGMDYDAGLTSVLSSETTSTKTRALIANVGLGMVL